MSAGKPAKSETIKSVLRVVYEWE